MRLPLAVLTDISVALVPVTSLLADSPGQRAGNVGEAVLIILGLVAFVAVGLAIGHVAHQLVEMGWPLWLSGGIGFAVLIAGYIAGSVITMQVGGVIMAASIGIALFGYMMEG